MKKFFYLIPVLLIFIIFAGCASKTHNSSDYNKCNQELLHQFVSNEEDLLVTHEATGIVEDYAEYAGQYVVKINRGLWDSTTWEQRQLIRCSTETIAHKKGLKGIVLDPNLNEKLN